MNDVTRVFIHGLESSGKGTKGLFFSENYPNMIIEDYYGPLSARMDTLQKVLEGKDALIIVGSSYGGLMAVLFACANPERVKKLILLAPALELQEEFSEFKDRRLDIPVIVYHGRHDDVVPVEPVRKIAADMFPNLEHHIIDDNHSIEKNFKLLDWKRLLCY